MADAQAEGGHVFSGDQPPTVSDYKSPETNVQPVDFTSIDCGDETPQPADASYPGGDNGPGLLPLT